MYLPLLERTVSHFPSHRDVETRAHTKQDLRKLDLTSPVNMELLASLVLPH